MKKISSNKNFLILAYKLLNDALFLLLFSFILILIAEGLIPGIISSHIGLMKFVLLIILTSGAIVFLGEKLGVTYPKPAIAKNKLLPWLILLSFLLIGNSLMHFRFWENIAITLTSFAILYYLYEILILKD